MHVVCRGEGSESDRTIILRFVALFVHRYLASLAVTTKKNHTSTSSHVLFNLFIYEVLVLYYLVVREAFPHGMDLGASSN